MNEGGHLLRFVLTLAFLLLMFKIISSELFEIRGHLVRIEKAMHIEAK